MSSTSTADDNDAAKKTEADEVAALKEMFSGIGDAKQFLIVGACDDALGCCITKDHITYDEANQYTRLTAGIQHRRGNVKIVKAIATQGEGRDLYSKLQQQGRCIGFPAEIPVLTMQELNAEYVERARQRTEKYWAGRGAGGAAGGGGGKRQKVEGKGE